MLAKTFLPALAVFGVAAAQSNSICGQPTATIINPSDATQYASCTRISGDVLVPKEAIEAIDISGPREISGSLIVENAGRLVTLSSSSIETIGKSFTLTNLTTLSTLRFDRLTEVSEIRWSALPALSQLTFASVIRKAARVLITNTFLSTLDGINLATVQILNINNNNRLRVFSTQVGNITQALIIDSNGQNLDVSFPNLIWAANMTFRNASKISMPSLARVNGSIGFYGNYIESLSTPNLTAVGDASGQGSLAFVANGKLANISMPALAAVGGAYQIANNSALTTISFPSLQQVNGAVDFSGNFSTPELPKLRDVKGGFNMQSTAQIDCSPYQKLRSDDVIQGTFTCKTTADAKGRDSTTTDTSSSPSPTKSKDAAGINSVSQGVIGLSVLGGLIGMLV